MTPAEQACYDLGFARGSCDEGAYQRQIASLRAEISRLSAKNERLSGRAWALSIIVYSDNPGMREAVEGDI